MGSKRDFSDSIKLEVIKENLRKNNGSICCEACKTQMSSIEECHFDHIYPYAKGGKSSFENCQILCSECNLRKNDKELQDFMLEERAKMFLSGGQLDRGKDNEKTDSQAARENSDHDVQPKRISKAEFDAAIWKFIDRKGDIHKVDFTRAYNMLPSIWYVREYYGDLNSMKKAFGIEDLSANWTRERIKQVLLDYVAAHGAVCEKDLKKKNGLPSYPCIMKYYPEYKTFSLFKQEVLGMEHVYKVWTKEEMIASGKVFVEKHGSLTEKDLKAKNSLPTSKVIYTHFGTLANYQKQIGAPVQGKNEYITKEAITKAVDEFFGERKRIVASRKEFFATFPYSLSVVYARFGSFTGFCEEHGIEVMKTKRAAWTKKEIDDAVHNWIFSGNDVPKSHELTKLGLPSMAAIMKFYESWKEPFVIYQRT